MKTYMQNPDFRNAWSSTASASDTESSTTRFPLAGAQRFVWFHQRINPDCTAYNIANIVHIKGDLNQVAFLAAHDSMLASTESVRLRFVDLSGEPFQYVAPFEPGHLPVWDFSAEGDADTAAEHFLLALEKHPFDLERDTCYRYGLLKLAQDRWIFFTFFHHLVIDALGGAFLINAVASAYESNETTASAPASVSWTIAASDDQTYQDSTTWAADQKFWEDKLTGLEAPVSLCPRPFKRMDLSVPASVQTQISRENYEKITQWGVAHGRSAYAGLATAVVIYLSKMSGSHDVCIGSPTSGRTKKSRYTIGMLANAVPVRVGLATSDSLKDIVQKVGREVRSGLRHNSFPFGEIAQLRRQQHLEAPFSVLVNHLVINGAPAFGNAIGKIETWGAGPVADLEVQIFDNNDNGPIVFRLDFNVERYTAEQAQQHLERLAHLIKIAPFHTDTPLAAISLLDSTERTQVLEQSSGTMIDLSRHGMTIPAMFSSRAQQFAEAVAIISENDTGLTELTYAELEARSNKLARYLISQGIGAEQVIAVLLNRSPELIVTLLAIMKAGAVYLPIDPDYPASRIEFLLLDSHARRVITRLNYHDSVTNAVQDKLPEMIDLDDYITQQRIEALPGLMVEDADRLVALRPENLAYVIYTSGSTGTPKGVAAPHRGVINLAYAKATVLAIHTGDHVLQFASHAFDGSVQEIFSTLFAGASLVLPVSGMRMDTAANLPEYLVRYGVTHATLPPALIKVLNPAELSMLRTLCVAGEACPPEMVKAYAPGRRMINGYGPTEVTVTATMSAPLSAATDGDEESGPVPIGHPINNVQNYLLDASLELVPNGSIGELFVAGVGVTRGYFAQPGLTAERFLACPFGPAGQRMYRTGDLAVRRSDGVLVYAGRTDDQVKIRGFRIELGEIESALLSGFDSIARVAVVAKTLGNDQRLVAYLVAKVAGYYSTDTEMRTQLGATLPEYMVPAYFEWLDSLPLTINGKVDIRALPDPSIQENEASYLAPESENEILLCSLFAELTGQERIGVDDDFFSIGGHSLLAISLIAKVRERTGCNLSLDAVFEYTTPRTLAPHIVAEALETGPALTAGAGRLVDNQVVLSFGQSRIWALQQLGHASAAYNIPAAWVITGKIDTAALQSALIAVITRHETLRTIIVESAEGVPIGQLLPVPDATQVLTIDELTFAQETVTRSDLEQKICEIIRDESERPFDLTCDFSIRAVLTRIYPERHLLTVTLHHQASDGVSGSILFREIGQAYQSALKGQKVAWPALPIQYSDWAAWQKQLEEARLEQPLARAKARLAGTPELLTLPVDRPRHADRSRQAAYLPVTLSHELSRSLDALAKKHSTTLYTVLMAGFGATLARIANQQTVVLGSPVALRDHIELENLVGFLTNTVAVPISIDHTATGIDLIVRTRESVEGALIDKDLPFERLVENLDINRSLSHTPIFQAMMAYQSQAEVILNLAELVCTPHAVSLPTIKFDLLLFIGPNANGELAGIFEYDASLFDEQSIFSWAQGFEQFMRHLVQDPAAPIATLPLLTAVQRQKRLEQALVTQTGTANNSVTLIDCFDAQVRRTPNATALMYSRQVDDLPVAKEKVQTVSFSELDALSNQLAHHLLELGVRTDQVVAVWLDRSVNMIVSMLGILKAGAAYLPLDPEYPSARAQYMLQDSAAPLVITSTRQYQTLTEQSNQHLPRLLDLDHKKTAELIANQSAQAVTDEQRSSALRPENLAYLIYTSGSTGQPKGAGNTHEAVVNHMEWMQDILQLGGSDRILQKTGIGFDVAVFEWFVPLMTGATLFIGRPSGHKDPAYLQEVIEHHQISVIHFVPSMLAVFLEQIERGHCSSLRQIVASGEALSGTLSAQLFERLPQVSLWNLYGPTEAAIHVCVWQCLAAHGAAMPPIGAPIRNIKPYILDATLEPVPVGVVGELYIAGIGLARGYLNREGLTAERFIACPFDQTGQRMYRTGDLARQRADGVIEYLGRLDDQIKIRGFRVELGEIEAALLNAFEQLAQVAVIVIATEGNQHLVAYLVARPGFETPEVPLLRSTLAAGLPEYMVPTYFVSLAALPLNLNGKLDRKSLPAPDTQDTFEDYIAPSTENEKLVTELFCQLTNTTSLGVNTNFFSIGGQSLLAMSCVARLKKISGKTLSLRQFFEMPTIRAIAAFLDQEQQVAGPTLVPGMGQLSDKQVALSYGQKRLWMLDQVDGPSATYNMSASVHLTGDVDLDALKKAFLLILARHQPLRTVIRADEQGNPCGFLADLPEVDRVISLIDLREPTSHEANRDQSRLQAIIDEESSRPFDLSCELSLRATLVQLTAQQNVLVVTMHHQATDEASVGIFVRELSQAYNASREGITPTWQDLPIQYSDWAAWQHATLSLDITPRVQAIKQQLADSPEVLTLPLDHVRISTRSHAAKYVPIRIARDVTQKLEAIGLTQQTTLFAVLLAAFSATLSRLATQKNVVIGTPVAGRTRDDTESLIGFLLNTLAIPLAVDSSCTGLDLIDQASTNLRRAIADQDIPFEKLVEEIGVARSLVHTPVFQAMFSYENWTHIELDFTDLESHSEPIKLPTAKFDLTLHLGMTTDGILSGHFEYDSSLFDEASVCVWAKSFCALTQGLAEQPSLAVATLPMLSRSERDQILARSEGPCVELPADALTLPVVFETQVALTPNALALQFEQTSMTYAQLNAAANQLARVLIENGIGTGDVVAILLDRSPKLIIALLAIVKAGAAYLPLDADYPVSRLEFMLTDSLAPVVLTSQTRMKIVQDILGQTASSERLHTKILNLEDIDLSKRISLEAEENITDAQRGLALTGDHLVYMMYTSGSTGKPKGVGFLHQSLINLVRWQQATIPSQATRVLQYSPIGFDASAQEIAWTFSRGATLILVDDQRRRDSRALLDYIGEQKIDHLYAPFVVLNNLAEARQNFSINSWPEAVFTAGEQLQITPDIRSTFATHPQARLHNFYGPTEAHVVSSYSLDTEPTKWPEFPPIGYPIWNTQLYVLDEALEPVADGVVGELYIGGMGLARGYMGRPGLTAERFMACPFDGAGSLMYRTGDLASRLPDSAIRFLGRADDQVKIRGFRIELGEIDAALLKHFSMLAQVAVIARTVNTDKRLVAYVVVEKGQLCPTAAELRAGLSAVLPDYMVPTYFVEVPHLPLSPSGKLDRRALPDPAVQLAGDDYRAPRSDSEVLLCRLFAEITGVDRVGLDDSFFIIGGHSLLAMRLVARIRQETDKTLALRVIFECPTPESLALHLQEQKPEKRRRLTAGMGRIKDAN